MKSLVPAIILSLLATACASNQPVSRTTSEVREVEFFCSDGTSLTMRFFSDKEIAVLVRNAESLELEHRPSGSGFIYSNGTTTISGKGNELLVEVASMVPLQCQAKQG